MLTARLIKVPAGFGGRNEQTDSEMHMETQRTSFANILLKMNETEGLTRPDFKAYDKGHMNQGRLMVAEQIGKSRNTATQMGS